MSTSEEKKEAAEQLKNIKRKSLVNDIYKLQRQGVIIGLTGRSGSGCSTTAEVLSADNFSKAKEIAQCKVNELRALCRDKYPNELPQEGHIEKLKLKIVENFFKDAENHVKFKTIKIRHIILLYAIENISKLDTLKKKLRNYRDEPLREEPFSCSIKEQELFLQVQQQGNEFLAKIRGEENRDTDLLDIMALMYEKLPQFDELLKKLDPACRNFSDVLQDWANEIRNLGSLNLETGDKYLEQRKNEGEQTHQADLAVAALKVIELIEEKEGNKFLFVIDSLRNPFEIHCLRAKRANFYMFSINMKPSLRREKLKNKGYSEDEINNIDEEKKGKKKQLLGSYTGIDISKCTELSDVYIDFNLLESSYFSSFMAQLQTYVALILHPGLIPPTDEERVMQVALAAKLNSGCLSRQVGAAVTNFQYSVCAVGWNIVPGGQTPCNLRTIYQLQNLHDAKVKYQDDDFEDENNADFSMHELNDVRFRKAVKELCTQYNSDETTGCKTCMKGLSVSYCFKDVYNSSNIDVAKRKNQVHTRSIHAEENAFLQLAKHGSVGIQGGYLFTTASCCVLCAKKAYQLGIKKIFYVDSYPDISEEHILKSGKKDNWPVMVFFKGVLGRAYTGLYTSLIPLKDEIQYLSGVDVEKTCNAIANDEDEMGNSLFNPEKDKDSEAS